MLGGVAMADISIINQAYSKMVVGTPFCVLKGIPISVGSVDIFPSAVQVGTLCVWINSSALENVHINLNSDVACAEWEAILGFNNNIVKNGFIGHFIIGYSQFCIHSLFKIITKFIVWTSEPKILLSSKNYIIHSIANFGRVPIELKVSLTFFLV